MHFSFKSLLQALIIPPDVAAQPASSRASPHPPTQTPQQQEQSVSACDPSVERDIMRAHLLRFVQGELSAARLTLVLREALGYELSESQERLLAEAERTRSVPLQRLLCDFARLEAPSRRTRPTSAAPPPERPQPAPAPAPAATPSEKAKTAAAAAPEEKHTTWGEQRPASAPWADADGAAPPHRVSRFYRPTTLFREEATPEPPRARRLLQPASSLGGINDDTRCLDSQDARKADSRRKQRELLPATLGGAVAGGAVIPPYDVRADALPPRTAAR